MRINPTTPRIRAVVKAATTSIAASAITISRAVVVPYISFRVLLGEFFKYIYPTDVVKTDEQNLYFAEDYVEPGYVNTPFIITFGKNVSELTTTSDGVTLNVGKPIAESAYIFDTIFLALSGQVISLETVAAGDSGSLQMHDYCGINYFAEDYVGQSRVFT